MPFLGWEIETEARGLVSWRCGRSGSAEVGEMGGQADGSNLVITFLDSLYKNIFNIVFLEFYYLSLPYYPYSKCVYSICSAFQTRVYIFQ